MGDYIFPFLWVLYEGLDLGLMHYKSINAMDLPWK